MCMVLNNVYGLLCVCNTNRVCQSKRALKTKWKDKMCQRKQKKNTKNTLNQDYGFVIFWCFVPLPQLKCYNYRFFFLSFLFFFWQINHKPHKKKKTFLYVFMEEYVIFLIAYGGVVMIEVFVALSMMNRYSTFVNKRNKKKLKNIEKMHLFTILIFCFLLIFFLKKKIKKI